MRSENHEPTIFILGAGGFAKELQYYFEHYHDLHSILIGPGQLYDPKPTSFTIMGSGHSVIRERMLKEIKGRVCPFVIFGGTCLSTNVGLGTVIAPGSVVAPNTVIGQHVLVNYGATVGHDTIVGDMTVIAPNASIGGGCKLGKGVYVGAGANIKELTTIADGVVVGMGAVVLDDILTPNVVVVGVPAKTKIGLTK